MKKVLNDIYVHVIDFRVQFEIGIQNREYTSWFGAEICYFW